LALRAAVYLATLGPDGMRGVAELCLQKAHYASHALCRNERFEPRFAAPYFKEFVVRDRQGRVDEILQEARQAGYFAGVSLGTWYPELRDCLLIAVTEKRSRDEIDGLAAALAKASRGRETARA
jgi:glycine dehydrogenase subunit 1